MSVAQNRTPSRDRRGKQMPRSFCSTTTPAVTPLVPNHRRYSSLRRVCAVTDVRVVTALRSTRQQDRTIVRFHTLAIATAPTPRQRRSTVPATDPQLRPRLANDVRQLWQLARNRTTSRQ